MRARRSRWRPRRRPRARQRPQARGRRAQGRAPMANSAAMWRVTARSKPIRAAVDAKPLHVMQMKNRPASAAPSARAASIYRASLPTTSRARTPSSRQNDRKCALNELAVQTHSLTTNTPRGHAWNCLWIPPFCAVYPFGSLICDNVRKAPTSSTECGCSRWRKAWFGRR